MDSNTGLFRCKICHVIDNSSVFDSREELEIHVANHYCYTPFECNQCSSANMPYKYPTEYSLIQHYIDNHPELNGKFYILKYYSEETSEDGALVLKAMDDSTSLLNIAQSLTPSVPGMENGNENATNETLTGNNLKTRTLRNIPHNITNLSYVNEEQSSMRKLIVLAMQPFAQNGTATNIVEKSMTTLRCTLCGPNSPTHSSLQLLEMHVSNHLSYTPYECDDCFKACLPSYKLSTEYAIMQHYKEAHPDVKRFKIYKYSSPETREVGTEVLKAVQQSIALRATTTPYVSQSVGSTENSVRNQLFPQSAVMDNIPKKKPKIENVTEVICLSDDDENVIEVPEDYPEQPACHNITVVNNASNDVETINLFSESVARGETKQNLRDKVKITEEDISNSAAIDSPVQLAVNQQQSEQMCHFKNEIFETFQDYAHNSTNTQFPEIPRSTAHALHVPVVNSSENSAIVAPSSDIPQDPRLKRKPIAVSNTPSNELNLCPNKKSNETAFQNINQKHAIVEQSNCESSSTWRQEIRHKLGNITPAEDALATNAILAPSSSRFREPEAGTERKHHSRKEDKVLSRQTSPSPERRHYMKAREMFQEREKDNTADVLEREDLRKLFLGSLPLKTTVESLRKFYSQFGKICDCFVKKWDYETHTRFRWGYVIFSKMEEVDNAIKASPYIDGIRVNAVRYRKYNERIPSFKLLIKGVHKTHTEKDFKKYFHNFGEVRQVNMNPTNRSAVVTFKSADSVDKCALLEEHSIADRLCNATRYLEYI